MEKIVGVYKLLTIFLSFTYLKELVGFFILTCIIVHTHCVLNTKGYKHTLGICNTYCFTTTTVVARMRLNVTLYVRCLSCVLRMCTCRAVSMDRLVGNFLSQGLLPEDRELVGKSREGVDSPLIC